MKGFKQGSDLVIFFEKNHTDCHVQTGLAGSNIESMKWIKVKVVDMETGGFERHLNVGIEWDLMIHWIQSDRALSGGGKGVDVVK